MRSRSAIRNHIWKQAPFLRLLFPLITGILIENYFKVPIGFGTPVYLGSVSLFVFCISICHSIAKPCRKVWIAGLVIQFTLMSTGCMLMHLHRDIQIGDAPFIVKKHPHYYLLLLDTDLLLKKESYKCSAVINMMIENQMGYYEKEKILVYFNKKSKAVQLTRGSRILIQKPVHPIENFNLSEFDYKKYCHSKHIYAQVFLNENDFTIIPIENENRIYSGLDSLRKRLINTIKYHIPNKSEYGLLEALLVGYTDDLDRGILASYADSGVIHIIAISGLHLALICHFLQLFLQGAGRKKSGKWIKLTILITCLWGYSMLSGASPSVIRAAAMFSLVLFAKNIFRENTLNNMLAASAFLLICFDPYWIWDTGFQLSYAAVLSLGLFAMPLRNLLLVQNKILAAIWNAASVSISAQILTTPLSIYYFHRFPSYFLVANLVAVPVSSVILAGGILLCLSSPIHLAARLLGSIVALLIHILNEFIRSISRLPGAVIGKLDFSLAQLILIYIVLFCFYWFWLVQDKRWLFAGLVTICIFQLLHFTKY